MGYGAELDQSAQPLELLLLEEVVVTTAGTELIVVRTVEDGTELVEELQSFQPLAEVDDEDDVVLEVGATGDGLLDVVQSCQATGSCLGCRSHRRWAARCRPVLPSGGSCLRRGSYRRRAA